MTMLQQLLGRISERPTTDPETHRDDELFLRGRGDRYMLATETRREDDLLFWRASEPATIATTFHQNGDFLPNIREATDAWKAVIISDAIWNSSPLLGVDGQTYDKSREVPTADSSFVELSSDPVPNGVSIQQLAEWSGYVTSIQEEGYSFSASLKGVSGTGVVGEQDDAIIPISDVAPGDKELLQIGNFFRLCVTQEIDKSGQPRRYTQVIFRRMPSYRRDDLDLALERGDELANGLLLE